MREVPADANRGMVEVGVWAGRKSVLRLGRPGKHTPAGDVDRDLSFTGEKLRGLLEFTVMAMNPPATTVRAARRVLATALASLILSTGCYDGNAIVNEVRSEALRTRLVEVDLGRFRTTMPRASNTSASTELKLHIFGTVPRYRVPEIEQHLKSDGFRLRHETLMAVRKATPEELAEPSLSRLRARIEKVVNQNLKEAPVKTVGFYELSVEG